MKAKSRTIHAALCALLLILAAGSAAAQDEASDLKPPEITDGEAAQTGDEAGQLSASGEVPPPQRTHRREAFGQTITEYERGGKVFLITVKPRVGPTQYWDDPDGDGQFQRSTSDNIDENVNLPKWRLGGW